MDTIKDPLFDKLYHIDQFMNVLALVLSESLLIFFQIIDGRHHLVISDI